MNNISAAIGLSQLPHIENIIEKHTKNGIIYENIFRNNSKITSLSYPESSNPSFWVYTVLISEDINRDLVIEKLNSEGINAGLVHIPNHNYTCFKESFTTLPETDYFSNHQISLPCGWWIEEEDVNFIAGKLFEILDNE
jgi:dTDP-4-amino-4,6-dideoxygalactose transaminase